MGFRRRGYLIKGFKPSRYNGDYFCFNIFLLWERLEVDVKIALLFKSSRSDRQTNFTKFWFLSFTKFIPAVACRLFVNLIERISSLVDFCCSVSIFNKFILDLLCEYVTRILFLSLVD